MKSTLCYALDEVFKKAASGIDPPQRTQVDKAPGALTLLAAVQPGVGAGGRCN